MKNFILLISLVSIVFSSCKTDFELNAPYKETMVIYGFLNANDSVQYIRISKGFLGEGNALIMAQQSDSINYADVLNVRMEEIVNGNVINTFVLSRVDTIPKEAGLFAYPYQVYYRLSNHNLNAIALYRLTAENRETGYKATSITRVVNDIVNITNPSIAEVNFASTGQFSVKFSPVNNGRIYDLVIRFHYTEDSSGVLSYHFVDWNFPDQFTSGSTDIIFPYARQDFYAILASSIPYKSGVSRTVGNAAMGFPAIEFRMIAGTEDLYTYQQLNSASNTSLQDPPLFTTVENGLGLFTSRLIHLEFRNMTQKSIDSLEQGQFTRDLF
ncbi:MAG: DUF4249 family protein [Bacteroidetes bacterium]|nr:MAG: DUF4249 family protein [Bacteroidota bacterium]